MTRRRKAAHRSTIKKVEDVKTKEETKLKKAERDVFKAAEYAEPTEEGEREAKDADIELKELYIAQHLGEVRPCKLVIIFNKSWILIKFPKNGYGFIGLWK